MNESDNNQLIKGALITIDKLTIALKEAKDMIDQSSPYLLQHNTVISLVKDYVKRKNNGENPNPENYLNAIITEVLN